jgi:hypothetical protein
MSTRAPNGGAIGRPVPRFWSRQSLGWGDDSRAHRRKPDAVAVVLAVSAVLWGVIGLVVLFVAFMAVGRWLIRKGTDIETHHHPQAEDAVETFEREQAQQRREP